MSNRLTAPPYPWAHYQTGSPQSDFARCTICGEDIAFWSPRGSLSIPAGARRKIDDHLATYEVAA